MSTNTSSADYGRFEELAEEFAARYRRGERPGLQEYIDRYPDLADEIRELFPALVEVERVKEDQPARPGAAEAAAALPPLGQVGDYRILREVGRGGMGVVYEAEQVSLGRRVALKVLPRQVSHDLKTLARFRREARAAAQLHHTNIVPVFEVGKDGEVSYYAMQFIQGQGLDLVIDELRRLKARASDRSGPGARTAGPADPVRDDGGRPVAGPAGQPDGPVAADRPVRAGDARRLGRSRGRRRGPDATAASTDRRDPDETGSPSGERARAGRRVEPALVGGAAGRVAALGGRVGPAAVLSQRGPHRPAGGRRAWPTPTRGGSSTATSSRRTCCWTPRASSGSPTSAWPRPSDDGLTQTGDILGTLRYMAPERFRGEGDAPGRRLRPGPDPLRAADAAAGVRRRPTGSQLIEQVKAERAAAAAAARPADPARPGDDRAEGDREGPAATATRRPTRWREDLRRFLDDRADPGAAGLPGRAAAPLGPPEQGRGRPARERGRDAGRRFRRQHGAVDPGRSPRGAGGDAARGHGPRAVHLGHDRRPAGVGGRQRRAHGRVAPPPHPRARPDGLARLRVVRLLAASSASPTAPHVPGQRYRLASWRRPRTAGPWPPWSTCMRPIPPTSASR